MSDTETKNEIPPTAPAWMASQTPKTDTMPPASGETKKARKPRRTKAQMLADAAARPDARESLVDTFTVPDVVANVSISTTMAAEDHRDAVVRDIARIAPRRVTAFFRWFDLWIGAFVDTRKRIIYVCPLPMIGVAIRY